VSVRDRIGMTQAERLALMAEQDVVVVVTSLGPRGWPHSMPMWFVVREGEIWIWTYAKSQKARNLERDPRATLLVEKGDSYEELRGVMIEAKAELDGDPGAVLDLGLAIAARHREGAEPGSEEREALEAQARKRVAVRFRPVRTISWDHRKLQAG
jgi:PPOX class probable F420-dependent enzyme